MLFAHLFCFMLIGRIENIFRGLLHNVVLFLNSENRTNPGLHLYHSESHVKHLIDSEQFKENDKKGIDVPFFDLEDILAATDHFSDATKLGQGVFGPVYKVIVLNFHISFISRFLICLSNTMRYDI